ncbi:hypothetical protein EDD21DRAFT_426698, partial [Dissophora ornata]
PLQNSPATVPSSQLLHSNTPLGAFQAYVTPSSSLLSDSRLSTSQLSMSVDEGMRKVPSTNEAYEMLQNLLLYYEQDHHCIGEQQTLLLPKWIHQQRQILNQADSSDGKVMWMRQQNSSVAQQQQHHRTQTAPFLTSSPESFSPHLFSPTSTQHHHRLNHHHYPLSNQSPSYPHSNFPQNQQQIHRSASLRSSPSLSPLSTTNSLPLTEAGANSTSSASIHGRDGGCVSADMDRYSASSSFPSPTSSIEQQTFFAHHNALQQQLALQQQRPQQQKQQQQQQQQQHYQQQQQRQ